MPSQKLGVDMPSTAMVADIRSIMPPRRRAERMPSGIAIAIARIIAGGIIASVFGRREKKMSVAGCR